jgi:ribonuclease T2
MKRPDHLTGVARMATLAALAGLAWSRALHADTGRFDYYLLTLSWSPAYCSWHPTDPSQCGGRRYAFVLHGLWPQYFGGGYPRECRRVGRVPARIADRALAIMPSRRLIQHEWDEHGACTTLDAAGYFLRAEQAFSAVVIPAAFSGDRIPQDLTAEDVAAAFRRANPAIPERAIVVKCRGPELEEVRICLSTDLKPIACGRGVRDACRRGPLQIRPVR